MMPVVIVHRGDHEYPHYAIQACNRIGVTPVFIGDVLRQNCDFVPLCSLSNSAASFRSKYRHTSVNPPEYEMFCFEVFFIARDFLKSRKVERAMIIDSDVLLLSSPNEISNVAPSSIISTADPISGTFTSGHMVIDLAVLEKLCEYYERGTSENVMKGLTYFIGETRTPAFNYEVPVRGAAMDHHLGLTYDVWKSEPSPFGLKRRKTLKFDCGQVYAERVSGELVRMLSLHFWWSFKQEMKSVFEAIVSSEVCH